MTRLILIATIFAPLASPIRLATAQEDAPPASEGSDPQEQQPVIPEDLIDDEHIREEFGVNEFTTPSIKRLFEDLERLGAIPADAVAREIPESTARDRVVLALSTGTLISEGFLAVQTEQIDLLEQVGRSLLKHAKVLGAGMRVTRHTKSILENSALGDWDQLKDELAATQHDVEAEMLQLRDVEVAHLISLGGWLRAFEIAAVTAGSPYDPEKTRRLARVDIAEYFLFSLEGLHPSIQEREYIITLREELARLRDMIDVPEGKTFTPEELAALQKQARTLVDIVVAERRK